MPDTWPIGVERAVTLQLQTDGARSAWTCSTCIPAAGACTACRAR